MSINIANTKESDVKIYNTNEEYNLNDKNLKTNKENIEIPKSQGGSKLLAFIKAKPILFSLIVISTCAVVTAAIVVPIVIVNKNNNDSKNDENNKVPNNEQTGNNINDNNGNNKILMNKSSTNFFQKMSINLDEEDKNEVNNNYN